MTLYDHFGNLNLTSETQGSVNECQSVYYAITFATPTYSLVKRSTLRDRAHLIKRFNRMRSSSLLFNLFFSDYAAVNVSQRTTEIPQPQLRNAIQALENEKSLLQAKNQKLFRQIGRNIAKIHQLKYAVELCIIRSL